MDTSQMDGDSPLLWLRIDPDMRLLREITLEQPDHQWQLMLRHERDIAAQLDAVDALVRFPTAHTRAALLAALDAPEAFCRVRVHACHALADVANRMSHTWNGPLPLIPTFKKFFMSQVKCDSRH